MDLTYFIALAGVIILTLTIVYKIVELIFKNIKND